MVFLKKHKVAVIGSGYWGKKHIEEYLSLGADVFAFDLLEENLEYCRNVYRVKTSNDYHEIFSDEHIRVVSICTQNDTHYQIAKDCMEAGKNVLVEKPLCMTIKEGRDLIDIAKDCDVELAVGHIFRYNNAIRKAKEMFERFELGNLRIIKLQWINTERLMNDRDVIFDLAPHPFDIIHYILKKNPDELFCIGNAYRRSIKRGAETVFITGRIGEVLLEIELSWLTPPKTRSLVMIGEQKSLIINCGAQTIELVEGSHTKNIELIPNNALNEELKTFLQCIDDSSKENVNNGEVGLEAIKMIDLCRKSLRDKCAVRFEWGIRLHEDKDTLNTISLVVPTRNEATIVERNLISIYHYLDTKFSQFEIVVSDFSDDRTPEIVTNLSRNYSNIHYFAAKEKGIGNGIRTGMENAQYDKIMVYPIDMSWDLSSIENSIRSLTIHSVVLGSREQKESIVIRPIKRRIFSKLYNIIVNMVFNLQISDTQCTIALTRYRAKRDITMLADSNSGFFHTQVLIYAKKNNLQIVEIPVMVKDTRKDSKMNPIPDGILFLKEIFNEWRRLRTRELIESG